MEYWDLYDKDRNKLTKQVKRGEYLNDDEFHLVINAWIKNDNDEFLITQRAANRSHPLKWECTGGSAQAGESSIEAAIREVKEELGIDVSPSNGKLVGTTFRYYKGCPDILDVWIFTSNENIENVTIQEEEVADVKWASIEEIRELFRLGKFEANAMFEKVLLSVTPEPIYYIGFNANNAICNENFFAGSITLYPNKELGNIYYSNKLLNDTKSEDFMKKYRDYIYKTILEIKKNNSNAKFIYFNSKIKKLCSDMEDVDFIEFEKSPIIDKLNNKYYTRELVKDIVPVMDYIWLDKQELKYSYIKKKLSSNKFVIQADVGAGGEETYCIAEEKDMNNVQDSANKYCVSKYLKHIPLNITIIIGEYDTIYLPISAQLISLINNKYKYVGADFVFPKTLDKSIITKIEDYSAKIIDKLKEFGYKGILGIDYILDNNNNLYFMEINPRFQSSSFLISLYLEKYCNTSIAEMYYLAATGKYIGNNYIPDINQSFLNCNINQKFNNYKENEIVDHGYFSENQSSYYRKIFNYSILNNMDFENLN